MARQYLNTLNIVDTMIMEDALLYVLDKLHYSIDWYHTILHCLNTYAQRTTYDVNKKLVKKHDKIYFIIHFMIEQSINTLKRRWIRERHFFSNTPH